MSERVKLENYEKEAIEKWLNKGNKVTICPAHEKTDSEKIVTKMRRGRRPKPKSQ